MKKNLKKLLAFSAIFLISAPTLTGCSANEKGVINLRILNSEDYIDEGDEEAGRLGTVEAFEKWEREVNHKKVKVIYDTFDTNETMLSSLKTGKSTYDLITPSDYAIQKMMREGMLEPFDESWLDGTGSFNYYHPEGSEGDANNNYTHYASPYLLSVMDSIKSSIPDKEHPGQTIDNVPISKYAVGYMWGTLGLLYNPEKIAKDKKNLEEEEIHYDLHDWNSLWDSKYYLEMSIKDSMRDTYSVGIMKEFDEALNLLMEESGCFENNGELKDGYFDIVNTTKISKDVLISKGILTEKEATEDLTYNEALSAIFNRCDQKSVKKVERTLLKLKSNVFGFEVDSGKDDMVKGRIGINLAWSGDAVYSIDKAENEADQIIYYSIPKTGGNIWFDGWVMPKSSSLHKEEAQEFLDFISHPSIASNNMDYVGYTSFIAGSDVHNLIREYYDPRSYALYTWVDDEEDWESSDFLRDEEGNPIVREIFKGSSFDEVHFYKDGGDTPTYEGDWEGFLSYYNALGEDPADLLDGEESLEWGKRDLTYMFEGTLGDVVIPSGEEDNPSYNPYIYYTNENVVAYNPENENAEAEGDYIVAGRGFFAQYPPQNLIPKLAIMKDYGENNKYVLAMWENVKGNNLPIWGVIIFAIIIAAILIFIGVTVGVKIQYRRIKVARRKEVSANLNK